MYWGRLVPAMRRSGLNMLGCRAWSGQGAWCAARQRTLWSLIHLPCCTSTARHPCLLEPRRFVAGGSDMWVRLHDYETGQELEVCKGEPLGPAIALHAMALPEAAYLLYCGSA